MTPDPHPTPAEQAAELEVAAKIAHHLRMQALQDQKNGTH